MPLKLIPPSKKRRTPYFTVRGTHIGVSVNRSTKTSDRALAKQFLKRWERQIEAQEYATPGEETFASATVNYLKGGGDHRPTSKLLEYFKETPLREIDQNAINAAAFALFPSQTAATRNREVYTPVSAILKSAGAKFDFKIRRPKGSRGKEILDWLWPEQAFRIFDVALAAHPEFGVLLVFLLYTGCRISEALRVRCNDLRLEENSVQIRRSKNGSPRAVFLPQFLVETLARHPRGVERGAQRLFRFHQGGSLRYELEAVCMVACGLPKPKRVKNGPTPVRPPYELDWVTFHIFCHTYGTWMRRYGGLDVRGLVATGRWKSEQSAARYAHVVPSEESARATRLPTQPANSSKR